MGVLSWLVREGHADGVDLGGLAAAFVIRYDDDEPGSPWSFVVHVDERGSEEQRDALAAILTGRLGGDDVLRLPWVRKPSEELAVRTSPIELRFGPRRLRAARRLGDRPGRDAAVRDRRARQLRHPRPPRRRHGVLRRPARRRTTSRSSGSSRATAPSSATFSVLQLMPSSTVCLSFDFDATVGVARVRPRDAGDAAPRRVRRPRRRAPHPRAARAARAAGDVLRPGPHGRVVSGRDRVDPRRRPRDRPPLLRAHRSERAERATRSGPTWNAPGACSSGSASSRAASARPRPISRR